MNPCLSGAPSGTNLLVDREGIRKWKWHLAPAQTSSRSVLYRKHFQYPFSVKFKCYNTNMISFIGGSIVDKNRFQHAY